MNASEANHEKGTDMLESLERMILAGVGVLSVTRERAEKVFDDLVRRGEAEQANRGRFVQDMIDTAATTRREFEELIARQVHQVMTKLNLPGRDDLARIEARLDQLLAKGGPHAPADGTKPTTR
jgi:polyhydroxyalkanoate synthesis regulator phasin